MTTLIKAESKVMTIATAGNVDLIQKWIAFAQVKPASVRAYTKGVKNFYSFLTANAIENISRDVMIRYRDYLGAKYKAATANLYMTATKLFVTFLYQEGRISTNVGERIKNFKVEVAHAKDALTAEKTKEIIGAIDTSTTKGKRDAAIYATMTTCGLRCVEIVRANVEDMTERGGKIFLYILGKGRDEKKDCVELPAGVYNLVMSYLAKRGKLPGNAPLFASVSRRNNGERLTATSVSRIVKGIFRANGIDSPRVTAHSLRHTCATVMINNGVELRKVQEVLRHRSVTVTERYLHDLNRYNNGGESVCAAAFGL